VKKIDKLGGIELDVTKDEILRQQVQETSSVPTLDTPAEGYGDATHLTCKPAWLRRKPLH
jgi:hypothetical protein